MFTVNLEAFKIQEKELHRQAVEYHLIRTLDGNKPLASRISEFLGKVLIHTGQQLINQSRAAAH